MTTNIINGGLECNMPINDKVEDRVGFFTRYADLLVRQLPAARILIGTMGQ